MYYRYDNIFERRLTWESHIASKLIQIELNLVKFGLETFNVQIHPQTNMVLRISLMLHWVSLNLEKNQRSKI